MNSELLNRAITKLLLAEVKMQDSNYYSAEESLRSAIRILLNIKPHYDVLIDSNLDFTTKHEIKELLETINEW